MKKILIIDDDLIFAKICEGILREAGFLVEVAGDGERAIESLRTSQADLVLVDLFMRKMNGVQVLKHIRSFAPTHSIPVIAFSTATTSRLVDGAWRAGANRFLAKDHFEPDLFLRIVKATLAEPNPYQALPGDLGAVSSARLAASGSPLPEPLVEYYAMRRESLQSLQSELRRTFLKNAPRVLGRMHLQASAAANGENSALGRTSLMELRVAVRALKDDASFAGIASTEQLSTTLDALLNDLLEEPANVTESSLGTVVKAVETLGTLAAVADSAEEGKSPDALAAVVDEDATSRWMIGSALELASLKALNFADPNGALRFLSENSIDLVLATLPLPRSDAAQFKSAVRALPAKAATPLIFVAASKDAAVQAGYDPDGGDDFIAKPFLLAELSVKALTGALQRSR